MAGRPFLANEQSAVFSPFTLPSYIFGFWWSLTADLPGKGPKPRRLPITSQTARHFGRYAAVFHPSPEPAAPMSCTVRNGEFCAAVSSRWP